MLGGKSIAPSQRTTTLRRCALRFPNSWPQRIFILVALAEAVINISIETILIIRYKTRSSLQDTATGGFRALPVFVLCFCLAHSYQVLLSIDACVNRNTILVVGLAVFNACFLVYAALQIGEIREVLGDGTLSGSGEHVPVQILTGAIPVVIGVAQICYLVLGWLLQKEFGWQVYKSIIGADRILKQAFLQYEIYVVLLKFDFFVFVAFCLQLVLTVLGSDPVEKVLTMVAAPLVLILLLFAWWSVRREKKWGMGVFMCGLLGAAFYFSWKLWRCWSQKDGTYAEVYKSLTVFAVIALALCFSTAILSIRCTLNFGKGLCRAMDRARTERKASVHQRTVSSKDMLPLSSSSTLHLPIQPRISLD